jgi:hypothetical protein
MRAMPANHWKSVRVPFPPKDVEGERGRAAATFRGCCAARHGEFLPLGPVSSKEEYVAGTRLWGGFLVGGGGLAEGGGLGHARTGFTRRRKGGAIANCEMGRGSGRAGVGGMRLVKAVGRVEETPTLPSPWKGEDRGRGDSRAEWRSAQMGGQSCGRVCERGFSYQPGVSHQRGPCDAEGRHAPGRC